jgi:hypothetical protein
VYLKGAQRGFGGWIIDDSYASARFLQGRCHRSSSAWASQTEAEIILVVGIELRNIPQNPLVGVKKFPIASHSPDKPTGSGRAILFGQRGTQRANVGIGGKEDTVSQVSPLRATSAL